MGHRERNGVIWLIIVTLATGGLGLWLRNRQPADSAPTAVTVYKIEKDTVYRTAKKKKTKKNKQRKRKKENRQSKRKKENGSANIPSARRDFLKDTISCKSAE